MGRVVVWLVLLALVVWGGMRLYRAYEARKRAEEIAPVHAFVQRFCDRLKSGQFFEAQTMLSAPLQHTISIDWIAHFADNSDINATTAIVWGDWNKTQTSPISYRLVGHVTYTTGRSVSVRVVVERNATVMTLEQCILSKRHLKPKLPPSGL
jgi:hypothetical protein